MENHVIIDGIKSTVEPSASDLETDDSIRNFIANHKQELAIDKLTKYYLNDHLNFLCGSGTSRILGGRTINISGASANPFQTIIDELSSIRRKPEYIKRIISFLESDKYLEWIIDRVNQEYLFHCTNLPDKKISKKIKTLLDRMLKIFVDNYIPFPSDYVSGKLEIHELFINKIIGRKEALTRPKIFTPNYDLAFENACETLSIGYTNGFKGMHKRKFNSDTFQDEIYIRQEGKDKAKKIGTYLNIYKLHGSISWQSSDNADDIYNLQEIQILDNFKKEDFQYNALMIYPLQSKKSYSLDLPYSELFRNFSKSLSDSQNTLVILGYSFQDEHINDIIKMGLYNPRISLIIHSYDNITTSSPQFLRTLKNRSMKDPRIIIFEGNLVGDFTNYVRYFLPINPLLQSTDSLTETLKALIKKINNDEA